jgi:D-alanyl-D-alanine carboxypeptidase
VDVAFVALQHGRWLFPKSGQFRQGQKESAIDGICRFPLARAPKSFLFSAMIFGRRFTWSFLIVALGVVPSATFAAKAKSTHSADTPAYKGAIVMDAATGKVLLEDNADVISPPASMTKLMTFAVVHDKLAAGALTLSTPVRIEPEDAKMGGTQVYLDPRETFPVEELIYAMMIQSANDAAHALGRAAGGSIPAFVEMMNAKARAIGMTHTTFRSPHGLPPSTRRIAEGDLTTPRDFALLSRYLVTNTDVLKYTSVRMRDFGTQRSQGPQHMRNHNNLLGKVSGVDGLKTGYTEGAGYCLSATAERKGHRIIAVVMGSFGPNGQKDLGRTRDRKTIELLEQGFAAIPAAEPAFTAAAGAAQVEASSPVTAAPLAPDEKRAEASANEAPAIKFAVPATPRKK